MAKEDQQGEVKARGMCHVQLYIVIHFFVRNVTEFLQRVNDTSYVHIIIIISMNVVDNLNPV
jgi:hypothetical protein